MGWALDSFHRELSRAGIYPISSNSCSKDSKKYNNDKGEVKSCNKEERIVSKQDFENQKKYVKKCLNRLEVMLEEGANNKDCILEFENLKDEIYQLIGDAEEIIEGINNL